MQLHDSVGYEMGSSSFCGTADRDVGVIEICIFGIAGRIVVVFVGGVRLIGCFYGQSQYGKFSKIFICLAITR